MRDTLSLVPEEVAWFVSALDVLEALAAKLNQPVHPSVAPVKRDLARYLETRAPARADARTRGLLGMVAHDEVMTDKAAARLGLTEDAVRLACRTGRFVGVARKQRGRWVIPAVVVEAEAQRRGAA